MVLNKIEHFSKVSFCVDARDSILEILHIFLRLNLWPRLDFEPNLYRGVKTEGPKLL